ncbi:MAG TPA: phytoene desaturase family protein [Caldilineaceae bacterium]|nr:phytoene desaturase family protein [Caldilineaceae bacterium]
MASAAEPPIVVVGAGIGGLSAAICLAAQGQPVMLVEQQAVVGGKMGYLEDQGFRWDTGPSVITMRPVFEQLFARAGKRMAEYLELVPVEPLTRYFYPDGVRLDMTRDWPRLAEQIAALDPRDVAGYLRFLAFAAEVYRITGPAFLYGPPPSLRTFAAAPPASWLKIGAWSSMSRAIARHVHSAHLRQLLGRFATYVGASPYHAPATLSVIAHVELTGGVWYPRGGVYQIAHALERVAAELGVTIQTAAPVETLCVEYGRVAGVAVGGEFIPARAVVANVDVATVYQRLLPPGSIPPRVVRRLATAPTSCSAYVLLLGVKAAYPTLAHHNIFFGRDYRQEFVELFDLGLPPSDPTIYASITAKSDPSHAPPGCENWFVLVNAPALDGRYDWAANRLRYRDLVLAGLARYGFDLERHIVAEHCLTPVELASQTGAWRGALYGLSSNSARNAFRRSPNRCPYLDGLYFAGGSVHPGGGVPLVILSGMAAADRLLSDRAAR